MRFHNNIFWAESSFFLYSLLLVVANCDRTMRTAGSSGYEFCASDCFSNGKGSYHFCYVAGNKWDYCSPNSNEGPLVRKQFTTENDACKGTCDRFGGPCYTCQTYSGSKTYCNEIYQEYIQGYTTQGDKCNNKCEKGKGTYYYWCYYATGSWHYCSPPSKEYAVLKMKELRKSLQQREEMQQCKKNYDEGSTRKLFPAYGVDNTTRRNVSVLEYAASLLALGTNENLIVRENKTSPIYRYAYLDRIRQDDPVIPLMISARITANSLNPVGSRNSSDVPSIIKENVKKLGRNSHGPSKENDESGHLIAYQNGGPFELYNFAPQPKVLNKEIVNGSVNGVLINNRRSAWLQTENVINAYVRSGRGEVDETVVCVYEGNIIQNPRPLGFGVHLRFYYPNGTINYECDNYYSNDPNSLPQKDEL